MISVSSKHALRALKWLANEKRGEFVSIKELSRGAEVPQPYLSKLMKILAKKKLVATKKGVKGGVMLRKGSRLSFLEVCQALDDPVVNNFCLLSRNACGKNERPCALHNEWKKERARLMRFLASARL